VNAAHRISFVLSGLLLVGRLDAQTPAPPTRHEIYTAKSVNLSVGAGHDVRIDVFRWSTEGERQAFLTAAKNTDDKVLAAALEKAPSVGTVWTNESLGYTIRYAYTDTVPNNVERVVVVIDGRLGAWSGQPWKPTRSSAAPDAPFTLIELRLGRAGGDGKMSLSNKISIDDEAKTLTLSDFDAAPVLLRPARHNVEHQK
jgi:hypothetical protein